MPATRLRIGSSNGRTVNLPPRFRIARIWTKLAWRTRCRAGSSCVRDVRTAMPEKILFVDDDPAILSAFLRLLRHETLSRDYLTLTPFVVDTAPGGPEALAAMRQRGPYAVIVSDLRMPGLDGVQLLEEARAVSPQSVRILLTGQ